VTEVNPLNAELKPIRHLLALVGGRHFVHVSKIRVNDYINTDNLSAIIYYISNVMRVIKGKFLRNIFLVPVSGESR
jgi:hypothetical protein